VVAHDLRSPLNSLFGFSNLLVKHADSMTKEEIQTMGAKLRDSVANTLKMTENLITWARSQMLDEQTNPELVELKSVVDETLKVLRESAEKKGVLLDDNEVSDAQVFVDKNHLSLILRNLINNAIKYTKAGDKVLVKATQNNGKTKILIEDTGLGMDHETVEKLFSLERTVSEVGTSGERGTGLGLVLCKQYIERNHGSVEVHSEKSKGTRFIVTLPSSN
jgi:signal transduction histidine kinase